MIDTYIAKFVKRNERIEAATRGDKPAKNGHVGTNTSQSTHASSNVPEGQLDHSKGKYTSKEYMASLKRSGLFGGVG